MSAPASQPKIGSPEPIAALNRVRMTELSVPWTEREPLVDVRSFCPDVVLTERLCPYLRRTVAEMLNRAQASLPSGYKFNVGTCLRTLTMQKRGWDNYYHKMHEEHPNWPLSALRRATNKYFAPYDQKAPPGHCTGGAVDVGLLDPEGKALDMTAPTEGWEAAYTWSLKISDEARKNRMLMVRTMLDAGFSNCRDEYWHYSWGDSAWAVRVGERACPYGWAHPSVVLETDFPDASAAEMQIETARDFHGRALSATGSCSLASDAGRTSEGFPLWSVGLYWANGVPVTLHLRWPSGIGIPTLYAGDGKEAWQALQDVRCEEEGSGLLLRLTPEHDRIILTTQPTTAPAREGEPG